MASRVNYARTFPDTCEYTWSSGDDGVLTLWATDKALEPGGILFSKPWVVATRSLDLYECTSRRKHGKAEQQVSCLHACFGDTGPGYSAGWMFRRQKFMQGVAVSSLESRELLS